MSRQNGKGLGRVLHILKNLLISIRTHSLYLHMLLTPRRHDKPKLPLTTHHSTTELNSVHPPPLTNGTFCRHLTTALLPCKSLSILSPQTPRSSSAKPSHFCGALPLPFQSSPASLSSRNSQSATLPQRIESQIPSRRREERRRVMAR